MTVEQFTPMVGGKPFRCSCRCNVFTKPKPDDRPNVYECNVCRAWYEGEASALPPRGTPDGGDA